MLIKSSQNMWGRLMRFPSATYASLMIGILVAPMSVGGQEPDSLALPPEAASRPPLEPVTDASQRNPFSGFETHYLSNGMKVWFKHLPGALDVSISVDVPIGSDSDPRGKEELAHFTEHMLFSDHDERTEAEVKDAIESRGGRRNGITTPDHTWYYVTISRQHGPFAIEWLARIVSPHTMDPAVVDRNRRPVALEINARPRELFEHVWAVLNPSWMLPTDFWKREFGLETRRRRSYDRWANLQGITSEDLQGFYDRHYAPAAMTLTIVGDLDHDATLELAERSFGSLPGRPVAAAPFELTDPNRPWATYRWDFGSNVRYSRRYKFFDPTAEDELTMLFLADLLSRRLNQRLRYGEQKAVYSLQVAMTGRGSARLLQIRGSIDPDQQDFALEVIEEEIDALRTGSLDPSEFEADRRAVVERLRGANQTSESLNFWVYRRFFDPNTYTDFPDVLAFFEGVTQQELASFSARNLVPERRILSLTRIQPWSQGLTLAVVLALLWVTLRIVAWALTQPAPMKEIRYVARLRMPILFRVGGTVLVGGMALVVARLTFFGFQWIASSYLQSVDAYSTQAIGYAVMLVFSAAVSVLYLARFPSKLLIFSDHVRIKSLAYKSRVFTSDDIAEISLRRFHRVWLSKTLFGCFPLTMGILRPGIYLKPKVGRAYFFRVRNTPELIEVLGSWWGEPISTVTATAQDVGKPPTERPTTEGSTPERSATDAAPAISPSDGVPVEGVPPSDPPDDIDYDSVGLSDEEMLELLGDTRRGEDDPTSS